MESQLEINENTRKRYFDGRLNKAFRVYYYLNEGLSLINNFKYIVGGILAFAYLIKLDSFYYIALIFLATLPILTLLGYIWARRAKRSMDWFGLEYTTHVAKYTLTLQERQNQLLEELKDLLERGPRTSKDTV